jgi:signal transduction histidine kinase
MITMDYSQALLDIVSQAVLVIDSEGKLLAFNNAAHQLLADLIIGTNLEAAVPSLSVLLEDLDPVTNADKREINLSDTQVVEATVMPFPPHGWAITLYDVSSYKELEVQRNDLLDEVAHDLKQPISAILSFSDVIRATGELTTQQSQFLDRIRRAGLRMSEQVRQLLDVSRLESGISLSITKVDLIGLARAGLDELEPRASTKHIQLVLDAPELGLELKADSSRIAQVIGNLVLNAIKYSPDNSTVTMKLWTLGDQAVFSITDQGIGIAPENIPHLFDRFFRVQNKQTRNIEGTGLGLYIVQSIVEQHDGTITVESELGKGSTFTVYLPLNGPTAGA